MTPVQSRAVLASLVLMAAAPSAFAQEISWQTDYAAALKAAASQGRPLLINVGSDDCYWCKQLEQRTLSDKAVRELLSERFVTLHVNGSRNKYLVEALRVHSYPTLVFAAPDGTIVAYKEGFQDVEAMKRQLTEVSNAVTAPEWMKRDHEAAVKAVQDGDYARAASLLRNV